jgi:hypothetical protein
MGQSIDYLAKREAECRQAAESATDPAVKKVHSKFADKYADALKAESAAGKPPAAQGVQISN